MPSAAVERGATVTADAPLDAIPVCARAGAVVPMYPDGVMTLVRESASVPGPNSVGDDGAFEEADGPRNALTQLADDPGRGRRPCRDGGDPSLSETRAVAVSSPAVA